MTNLPLPTILIIVIRHYLQEGEHMKSLRNGVLVVFSIVCMVLSALCCMIAFHTPNGTAQMIMELTALALFTGGYASINYALFN